MTPRAVVALQRQVGNAAVQRLLIARKGKRVRTSRLHVGSRGDAVRDLQKKLNDAGARPRLAEDGTFGRHVVAAVVRFQRKHHLTPDGVVGAKTLAALAAATPRPVAAPADAGPNADAGDVAEVGAADRASPPTSATGSADAEDLADIPSPRAGMAADAAPGTDPGDLADIPSPRAGMAADASPSADVGDIVETGPPPPAADEEEGREYLGDFNAVAGGAPVAEEAATGAAPAADEDEGMDYLGDLKGVTGGAPPAAEEQPEGMEYVGDFRATVPVERVGEVVGEELLTRLVAAPTAEDAELPPKYTADLKVEKYYRGKGKRIRAPEHISSEEDILKGIGDVVNQAKDTKLPFRRLFKAHFGWSDADMDKYLDLTRKDPDLKPDSGLHVRYLGTEEERREFEVTGSGTLVFGHRTPPETVDTAKMFSKASKTGHGIYVMDGSGRIYIGTHSVALFHHSSFLAAGAAAGAGDMKVENGVPTYITNHSGHYKPRPWHLVNVIRELFDRGVPLQKDTMIGIAEPAEQLPLDEFIDRYTDDDDALRTKPAARKVPA